MNVAAATRLTLADVEAYDPHAKRDGNRLRARCPLHRGDHQQSLSADLTTGAYHCFACGEKGKLVDFWTDRPAARPQYDRLRLSSSAPAPTKADDGKAAAVLADLLTSCTAALAGSPGERYLAIRGIPLAIAEAHGVGWAPPGIWRTSDRDPFKAYGCVTFPLSVGAYARAVHPGYPFQDVDKSLKHRKTTGTTGIFNPSALAGGTWVHICEAAIDVLTLAYYGRPAVALVGTKLTTTAAPLFHRCPSVVACLDADDAGNTGTPALAAALRPLGIQIKQLSRAALGGCEDLNAAHMAQALHLPPQPDAPSLPSPPDTSVYADHLYAAGDPRPDLADDSPDWCRLLELAYRVETPARDLFITLHGFRCIGLRLDHTTGGYRLRPTLTADGSDGWTFAETYVLDRRRWLVPHTDELLRLLAVLEQGKMR